jgi:hypothetical protein
MAITLMLIFDSVFMKGYIHKTNLLTIDLVQDLTSHLFSNPHTHFGESVQGEDDVNSRVQEARQLVLRFFNTDSSRYQVSCYTYISLS